MSEMTGRCHMPKVFCSQEIDAKEQWLDVPGRGNI
jgi:hypothetical protein